MNIQLLLTGDELMTGVTVDSNSALIARHLADLGLSVDGKVTVGDELRLLVEELSRLSTLADVLIVNGGLGPTVDDLTAQALAQAAGLTLREHPQALQHLETWLAGRGIAMNAANRKQAWLPEGCDLLPNPAGSAVGFSLALNDCLVLCTPGVPGELRRMMTEQVLPRLEQRFPGIEPVRQSRFHLFGIGESTLQQWLDDALPDWPDTLELGFRAGLPTLEIKITSRRREDGALHDTWHQHLASLLGDHIVASGDSSLAGTVLELLQQKDARLVTVETGTDGTLAQMLSGCPGAGQALAACLLAGSDRTTAALLDLPAEQDGADEVRVRALAAGALERTGADFALAVHCPPVGENSAPVRVAWGPAGDMRTRTLEFPRRSGLTRTLAAAASLDLLRRALMDLGEPPPYFADMRANRPSENAPR